MSEKSLAVKVVDQMFDHDAFSQWLDIERVLIEAGKCILRMKVRKDMLNGFGIAHGGITSISHTVALREGDEITATAEEVSLTDKIAVYYITIKNHSGKTIALFKGTVYRTSREWEV